MLRKLLFAAFLALLSTSHAFYLPGVAPKAYKRGDRLFIKVQSLTSEESSLTFDYYQLPYCPPPEQTEYAENLGEALLGEKSFLSPYMARVLEDSQCNIVCLSHLTPKEVEEFQDFIILAYSVNMRADNLPLAQLIRLHFEGEGEAEDDVTYTLGHLVGYSGDENGVSSPASTLADHYFLFNHLDFVVQYHPVNKDDVKGEEGEGFGGVEQANGGGKDGYFIVGFTVHPRSIQHEITDSTNSTCHENCDVSTCSLANGAPPPLRLQVPNHPDDKSNEPTLPVLFTYSVRWEESSVKWASRWDVYLHMTKDNIHWFSVINSLVVVFFLSAIVAIIMTRILRKDFAMYNELAQHLDDEAGADANNRDLRDETGWKLVYGDVFRAPGGGGLLLCVLNGAGAQLLCMLLATLAFAVFGFLSPSNRGALVTYFLLFFVLCGAVAGYVSARFAKTLNIVDQFKCTLMTSILLPAVVFAVFLVINLTLWSQHASDAVPFGTMLALMALWFGISLPLVFFGSYIGYKRGPIELPVRVNPIPRQIPPVVWYLQPLPSMLLGGVLPFGAVFVELTVILSSLWHHRFYYLFGFLFLVFIILIITVAETAIVLTYLHLCAEDYRWWWRSFMCGGSMAVYAFLYSTYYYLRHVHLVGLGGLISAMVHIGYTAVLSGCMWVMCGFVGCASCFAFCRLIYGSVKID